MKHLFKERGILATLALIILLSLSFFLGGMAVARQSESDAIALAEEKLERRSDKEVVSESEDFQENSREFAREILQKYGDSPLLGEVAINDAEGSLEVILNDVNAGNGAEAAILAMCRECGLKAGTAKIKDLTEEQIMEIDRQVFCDSNHPLTE